MWSFPRKVTCCSSTNSSSPTLKSVGFSSSKSPRIAKVWIKAKVIPCPSSVTPMSWLCIGSCGIIRSALETTCLPAGIPKRLDVDLLTRWRPYWPIWDPRNTGPWTHNSSLAPIPGTHCSKSSFFIQKFNFDFPRKLSIFFGWKTRENVVVLDFLAVDNFDFTRKIVKKIG